MYSCGGKRSTSGIISITQPQHKKRLQFNNEVIKQCFIQIIIFPEVEVGEKLIILKVSKYYLVL